MKLAQKTLLLPVLAALAFLCIYVAIDYADQDNRGLYDRLQKGHMGALRLCIEINSDTTDINYRLQDHLAISVEEQKVKDDIDGLRKKIKENFLLLKSNKTMKKEFVQQWEAAFEAFHTDAINEAFSTTGDSGTSAKFSYDRLQTLQKKALANVESGVQKALDCSNQI